MQIVSFNTRWVLTSLTLVMEKCKYCRGNTTVKNSLSTLKWLLTAGHCIWYFIELIITEAFKLNWKLSEINITITTAAVRIFMFSEDDETTFGRICGNSIWASGLDASRGFSWTTAESPALQRDALSTSLCYYIQTIMLIQDAFPLC